MTKLKTEKDMRKHKVPWFDNLADLTVYLQKLTEMEHNYGTAAYSMSLAGVAAFQFMAIKLGTTGFQASCADLDMVKRLGTVGAEMLKWTRLFKGPFKILDYNKMLYPQYQPEFFFQPINKDTWNWLKKQAKKELRKYLMKKKFRLNEILYRRFDFIAKNGGHTHYEGIIYPPNRKVLEHWKAIASGIIPFNCYISR